MDRNLVFKIIGKTNTVILEDQVYNIINILDFFRNSFVKNIDIEKENLEKAESRLQKIKELLMPIKVLLESDSIIGYTNSKEYLKKYINDSIFNLDRLMESFEPFNKEDFVLYTNQLLDLALKY